jgi:hypothetical protein
MGAWNSVSAIEPQAVILFLHLIQFIEYFEQSPLMRKRIHHVIPTVSQIAVEFPMLIPKMNALEIS